MRMAREGDSSDQSERCSGALELMSATRAFHKKFLGTTIIIKRTCKNYNNYYDNIENEGNL